ncbi:disrupted in renal carcinoma protein 2 homolog isoform X2 [Acanthaster planci]|uniref:Disrupted in renal carcinoma protein 2 homolog isoform X2 n=1 Tax=Acanthaster planci TaxID=133434 RepID=A0A8B7Z6E7_ACAPL|nr:disrupted in renal carcinoma protein 2 homolog isoform X2 [Acanthaster planci]
MAETDPLVSFAAPSDTRLHVHGSKYSTVNQNPQTRSLKKGTDKQEGAQHEAYPARWFILAVFSLLCALQAATWNTWGPIADTVKVVLNWTDSDIALLTNWGPISFVITGFLFSYLLLVKGLRYCVLCSSLIFLLGLGIRCLPVGIDNLKWTMNAGHVCIGIAGPVMMSAPTEVSAVWFPPHQRTTSTAISTTAAFLGMSASFLVGPLIVTSIPQNSRMRSYSRCSRSNAPVLSGEAADFTEPVRHETQGQLQRWGPEDDQDTVGWIGFISNIAGMLAGLVIARLVDLLGGRMKAVLILLTAGAFIGCVWCVLLSMRYIPYSLMSVYITCIIIGVCVNASPPIFFEITVEGMYPVSEGNTTMVLTYLNNVAALIFLALPLIPNIGVIWMNWLLLGAIAVCIPLLMMYKEHYNRLDEDKMESSIQN